MALEERALLVRLSISQWYNRALDYNVAKEVATKYGVSSSDIQDKYVKTLISKAAMRNINSAVSRLRTFHHSHTLPWQDNSVRILSSAAFFQYQQGISERKQDFEHAVERFVAEYPDWLDHARDIRHGLFNKSQYPTIEALRASFNVHVTFLPFPHVDDFRIQGLDDEQVAAIKAQTKAELGNTLEQANQELLNRLYERLDILHKALEPEKTILRNTVTSVQETVLLVEKLNITDSAQITLVCNAIRSLLHETTVPLLRRNQTHRLRFREQIAEILLAIRAGDR